MFPLTCFNSSYTVSMHCWLWSIFCLHHCQSLYGPINLRCLCSRFCLSFSPPASVFRLTAELVSYVYNRADCCFHFCRVVNCPQVTFQILLLCADVSCRPFFFLFCRISCVKHKVNIVKFNITDGF